MRLWRLIPRRRRSGRVAKRCRVCPLCFGFRDSANKTFFGIGGVENGVGRKGRSREEGCVPEVLDARKYGTWKGWPWKLNWRSRGRAMCPVSRMLKTPFWDPQELRFCEFNPWLLMWRWSQAKGRNGCRGCDPRLNHWAQQYRQGVISEVGREMRMCGPVLCQGVRRGVDSQAALPVVPVDLPLVVP